MSANLDSFASLSLEQKRLINRVCEQFEQAAAGDQPPRIEDYLDGVPEAIRESLFRELLLLECMDRLRRFGSVRVEELVARFPGRQPLIEAIVEKARGYVARQHADPHQPAAGSSTGSHEGLPEAIGRFQIKDILGSGGFGIVYLAYDPERGCDVALKVPHLEVLLNPALRRRFLHEAEAASVLEHPNLVKVWEVGEVGLVCYLASEYVPGTTLAAWLEQHRKRREPVPVDFAARLLEVVARAVQHANDRGVLHCDLKPANILLRDGPELSPLVTDFGLARLIGQATTSSGSGQLVGTPAYMAPEQAAGQRDQITARTDVYALGVVLYELLTGQPPFVSRFPLEVLLKIKTDELLPVRAHRPKVPADLEAVCLKCLEKAPERRYASAADMADDLGRFLSGEPTRARPVSAVEKSWRWCRRKPGVAGLAAALVIAVVGGLTAGVIQWRQTVDNEIRALNGEAQALANLRNAEAARQEAEEHFGMLRQLLVDNIFISGSEFRPISGANPQPETMLIAAETCVSRLLQRRGGDLELRALLAHVLTRLGVRQSPNESMALFEKAARLWEQIPHEQPHDLGYLAARATTYHYLADACARQGHLNLASEALETSVRLWKELAEEHPRPGFQNGLYFAALGLGRLLMINGRSEEEVLRWFGDLRTRPELLGSEQGGEVLLDMLRVEHLCIMAERHYQAKQQAAGLAAARRASGILGRYYGQLLLGRNDSLHLAGSSARVCVGLRRGGVPMEALRLLEPVNRSLAELTREAPDDHPLFVASSVSWLQIAKAHWQLREVEETLDAYQHALAAQLQACILAPTVTEYRRDLGSLYVQLGRKLCELGRLDEAAAYFRQRQALWPGDASKQAEVLRELRKWAAQVGENQKQLSPEERQERQRYLDLYACLESKGIGAAPATRSAKP